MKKLRDYWRHKPGKLPTRIVVSSIVITAILAFFLPISFSQDKPTQPIQDLLKNAKINFPEAVLQTLMDGESTTRVIVNLKDPLAVSQAQDDSRVMTQKEAIGFQVVRNLKDMKVRGKMKNDVKALQNRVIDALDAKEVHITNRYNFIFGFSAEVTLRGLGALLDNPDVLSVEEDRIVHAHLNQGIPLMNATTPRSSYNGSGISIAITDTGIDYTHPKLGNGTFPNDKVIGGYDTGQDDFDPMDGNGHGTACAGIAAGDLGFTGDYIGGVAYNAKLYALKMTFTATNSGALTSDMVEAWDWVVTHQNDDPSHPIMFISTSFGGNFYTSNCDSAVPAMTAAAQNAVSVGITLFVSSGNEAGTNGMAWPACISYVNSVGAVYDDNVGSHFYVVCGDPTTSPDQVTCYSNSASFLTLFAPSHDAYTTDITGSSGYSSGNYYDSFGGTSAASPYAAGAAASLQSAAKTIKGAYLSPAEVKSYLTNHGDSVTDPKASITKPRINLANAVNALAAGPEGLVYTSVTPCRIVDTRSSQGGAGPIIGGTQRNFNATGLCGVPNGSTKAVMINIAATNSTGMGNLRAFAYPDAVPFASVLNYGSVSGLNAISNAAIVPICDSDIHPCGYDFSIWVKTTTDVVVDVMGYFSKP